MTNTVGSSLAREADGVLYTHAGTEIGVAATKTFATQMVSQYLVALYLAQVRGTMFPEEIAEVLDRPRRAAGRRCERAIGLDAQCRDLAERYRRRARPCCSSAGTRATRPPSKVRSS